MDDCEDLCERTECREAAEVERAWVIVPEAAEGRFALLEETPAVDLGAKGLDDKVDPLLTRFAAREGLTGSPLMPSLPDTARWSI